MKDMIPSQDFVVFELVAQDLVRQKSGSLKVRQ